MRRGAVGERPYASSPVMPPARVWSTLPILVVIKGTRQGIRVDAAGNAYVNGNRAPQTSPVTPAAFQE